MSLLAKPGLKAVKVVIEKTIGLKIDWYTMILTLPTRQIHFLIPAGEENRKYPYEDKIGLMNLVTGMVKKELTTGQTLEQIMIHYTDKQIKVAAYFKEPDGTENSKTKIL